MDQADGPRPRETHIQDFIFLRELSEVYLLLDHISGRRDKSLNTEVFTEALMQNKMRNRLAVTCSRKRYIRWGHQSHFRLVDGRGASTASRHPRFLTLPIDRYVLGRRQPPERRGAKT